MGDDDVLKNIGKFDFSKVKPTRALPPKVDANRKLIDTMMDSILGYEDKYNEEFEKEFITSMVKKFSEGDYKLSIGQLKVMKSLYEKALKWDGVI